MNTGRTLDDKLICDLYLSGKSITDIGYITGYNISSVYRRLIKNEIDTNKTMYDYRWKAIKYPIDENFFKEINTQEKAYILGFLYADGNAHSKHCHIKLSLQECDKHILEDIKKVLNYDKPLNFKKTKNSDGANRQNQYSLIICNKNIYEDLIKYGVVPNKTFIINFPTWMESNLVPHFIRGYFDGDGCVSVWESTERYFSKRLNEIKKYKKLKAEFNIIGTIEFCECLESLFKDSIGVNCKIYNDKRSDERIVRIKVWRHEDMQKMYDYIYNDANLFLKRKKEKFVDFFKILKIQK